MYSASFQVYSELYSDDIFPGAKPLGKYHHFGKYYAGSPSLRVYK
jgi:hypothetical protein